MAGITTISFRSQLEGEIGDFLEKSRMANIETIQAMTDLIVDLSHYEEEGTLQTVGILYPITLLRYLETELLPDAFNTIIGK